MHSQTLTPPQLGLSISTFIRSRATSKDFLRTGGANTNTKNKLTFEKSYLDLFYGPVRVRNRSSILEILFLAPKNTFELLLGPEIDQFKVENVDI